MKRNKEVRYSLSTANDNEVCNKCWVKPLCNKSYGHCIGARYLANGDVSKPIEDFCNISKATLETSFAETFEVYGKNVCKAKNRGRKYKR
jgi:sulfatase maturation enzyme AslB (radical SAM superfamily)